MAIDFTKAPATASWDVKQEVAHILRKYDIDPERVLIEPLTEEGYTALVDDGTGGGFKHSVTGDLVTEFVPWPNDKVKHEVLSTLYGEV